jgi:hypothetical protein
MEGLSRFRFKAASHFGFPFASRRIRKLLAPSKILLALDMPTENSP